MEPAGDGRRDSGSVNEMRKYFPALPSCGCMAAGTSEAHFKLSPHLSGTFYSGVALQIRSDLICMEIWTRGCCLIVADCSSGAPLQDFAPFASF